MHMMPYPGGHENAGFGWVSQFVWARSPVGASSSAAANKSRTGNPFIGGLSFKHFRHFWHGKRPEAQSLSKVRIDDHAQDGGKETPDRIERFLVRPQRDCERAGQREAEHADELMA